MDASNTLKFKEQANSQTVQLPKHVVTISYT